MEIRSLMNYSRLVIWSHSSVVITLKEGVVLIVDAHGTFESPNIPSYDIMVENENMLYKHVKCDLVKSKI